MTQEQANHPMIFYYLGQLKKAWPDFKKSHDLNSEKFQCCEITAELFKALDGLEKHANEWPALLDLIDKRKVRNG